MHYSIQRMLYTKLEYKEDAIYIIRIKEYSRDNHNLMSRFSRITITFQKSSSFSFNIILVSHNKKKFSRTIKKIGPWLPSLGSWDQFDGTFNNT